MNPFETLPMEILVQILSNLSPQNLHDLKPVSKTFHQAIKVCIQYVHKGTFRYIEPGEKLLREDFLRMLKDLPQDTLVFPNKEPHIFFVESDTDSRYDKSICLQDCLSTNETIGGSMDRQLGDISWNTTKKYHIKIIAKASREEESLIFPLSVFINLIHIVVHVFEIRYIEMPSVLIHKRQKIIDHLDPN